MGADQALRAVRISTRMTFTLRMMLSPSLPSSHRESPPIQPERHTSGLQQWPGGNHWSSIIGLGILRLCGLAGWVAAAEHGEAERR
jgi:hypothetical protein